jgi:hypothetical protein
MHWRVRGIVLPASATGCRHYFEPTPVGVYDGKSEAARVDDNRSRTQCQL